MLQFRYLVKGKQWSLTMPWTYPQFSSLLKFLTLHTPLIGIPFFPPLTLFFFCTLPLVFISYEMCAICHETTKHCWSFSRAPKTWFLLHALLLPLHISYTLQTWDFQNWSCFLKTKILLHCLSNQLMVLQPMQPFKPFSNFFISLEDILTQSTLLCMKLIYTLHTSEPKSQICSYSHSSYLNWYWTLPGFPSHKYWIVLSS